MADWMGTQKADWTAHSIWMVLHLVGSKVSWKADLMVHLRLMVVQMAVLMVNLKVG